ncbi:MAG: hypothetical protein O8C66_11180 [Candidatus Methanoperedens sp.]|nr:hypothetical protein [Candidatus Methanoperedens sp.]MCZ7371062.1 hypothetical protein [Candidatus Methanoperedens sp.]
MNSVKIKILKSEDAVSETIGYSLILSIVLIGSCVMAVIAYPILVNIKDSAFMESEVEALTMINGRISMVAFGVSPSQLSHMDLNGGTLMAENVTSNRLSIIVVNESGYQLEIFNKSLGLIEYAVNNNRIAYEDGGMFRMFPSGEPEMISPPEFYYNGETLTIPIIRINSQGSIGGKGVVNVLSESHDAPRRIYPNLTTSNLVNPLYGKQIKIRLKSDYYKAWAQYIQERTEAIPLMNDVTHEVIVSFNSHPSNGPQDLIVPIEVVGLDVTNNTPLNQFRFNLTGVEANLQIDLRAPTADSDVFHLNLQKKCGGGQEGAYVVVSYNKGSLNETWGSCNEMIITNNLSIDLLNSSILADYTSNVQSGTWLNEASYTGTYQKPGNQGPVPLGVILQHYMKLISDTGTFAIYQGNKNGDQWSGFNQDNSTYVLDYNILPPNINYMHIVDYNVNVSFH